MGDVGVNHVKHAGNHPRMLHVIHAYIRSKCRPIAATGDAVALRVENRTSDREFAGSTPARALLGNYLRQVVHTLVSLSPSSMSWYRCKNRKSNAACGRGVVYCPWH